MHATVKALTCFFYSIKKSLNRLRFKVFHEKQLQLHRKFVKRSISYVFMTFLNASKCYQKVVSVQKFIIRNNRQ